MYVRSHYRLLMVAVLLTLILSVPALAFAEPQSSDNAYGTVKTGALNVRSGPGATYGIVAVVYQGQVFPLLARNSSGSWVQIHLYSGDNGWVNASYIMPTVSISSLPVAGGMPQPHPSVTPPQGPPGHPPSQMPGYTAVVTTGALNVRAGAGVGYNVVTVVPQGQTIQLLGRNAYATWVHVRAPNGAVGWVNAYYIHSPVPVTSLPVVGSPPPQPPYSSNATAVVTAGALNVRYGPGSQFGVVTAVFRGTYLILLGRNGSGSWVQVQTPSGAVGWVNANYIFGNVPVSNLPIGY